MTSGFTSEYRAAVWKFRPSRPSATSETSTSAIFRYVFSTSAEPYSSTNCRLAFSIVFGLRSPTVALMAPPLATRQTGSGSDWQPIQPMPVSQAEQRGDQEAEDEEPRHVEPRRRLARRGVRTVDHRLDMTHLLYRREKRRPTFSRLGRALSPLDPEKIDCVSDGTSRIPMQNVATTANAWRA